MGNEYDEWIRRLKLERKKLERTIRYFERLEAKALVRKLGFGRRLAWLARSAPRSLTVNQTRRLRQRG